MNKKKNISDGFIEMIDQLIDILSPSKESQKRSEESRKLSMANEQINNQWFKDAIASGKKISKDDYANHVTFGETPTWEEFLKRKGALGDYYEPHEFASPSTRGSVSLHVGDVQNPVEYDRNKEKIYINPTMLERYNKAIEDDVSDGALVKLPWATDEYRGDIAIANMMQHWLDDPHTSSRYPNPNMYGGKDEKRYYDYMSDKMSDSERNDMRGQVAEASQIFREKLGRYPFSEEDQWNTYRYYMYLIENKRKAGVKSTSLPTFYDFQNIFKTVVDNKTDNELKDILLG